MTIRFTDIGNRLRAFRLGSGLSADAIAERLGISRAALYRFEKGELVKIETLERLSELLEVSIPTLLGVGVEYIPSALSYFERLRQLEENAEHIVVLAGPISYLLASDGFHEALAEVLRESIPKELPDRDQALDEIGKIMTVLRARKSNFLKRKPAIVNLISCSEMEHFMLNGLVGRHGLRDRVLLERRRAARAEVEHLADILANPPIGIQVGLVPDTLPHTSFQVFREPDHEFVVLSPFRLGERPNVRTGVAMITAAPEALLLHKKAVEDMWSRAIKGSEASDFLQALIVDTRGD